MASSKEQSKYQIRCTNKFTNETGVGSGKFSKKIAELIAASLNNDRGRILDFRAIPYHPTNSNK